MEERGNFMKKRGLTILIVLMLNLLLVTYAFACGPLEGRMTGGGSVYTEDCVRVTHGFTLFNSLEKKSNNIQINWNNGNKFHLTALEEISYVSLNNGVIAIGTGSGILNGVEGAHIEFIFSDFGEPGSEDYTEIVIEDDSGNEVLNATNNLNKGNDQFHKN